MRLFVAEKPSLAKTLASGLGGGKSSNGYIDCGEDIITWCFGHLYELAQPEDYKPEWKKWDIDELPMIPSSWQKKPKKDAKKQLKIISKLMKKAQEVVNAGDPDREGQLLVDEVLDELQWSGKTSRVWLDALDDISVKKALNNIRPNSEYENLSNEAEARSRADWTIGLNATRAYTVKARNAGFVGVLTVGRVQTPTLALVVKRDLEIEKFKSTSFFTLTANFQSNNENYSGKWDIPSDLKNEHGYLVNETTVKDVADKINGQDGTVKRFEIKKKKKVPELPFSLSALQTLANKKWGYPAKKTLDLAQSLYEKHKATTYPRTDCRYLSSGQFEEVAPTMQAIAKIDKEMAVFIDQCDLNKKTKMFNDKKITAHTAIIPTMNVANLSALTKDESNLYDLIRRRYISQFLPAYEFDSTSIITECNGFSFSTNGNQTTKQGWRIIEGKKEDGERLTLPSEFKVGSVVSCATSNIEAKQTKPPQRFTEGTLVTAMAGIAKYVEDPKIKKRLKESAGIGTEATRGQILENLKNRNFITTKGKTIISTDTARKLISILPKSLTSAETTAMWEMGLDGISTGKVKFDDFMAKQNAWVNKEMDRARETNLTGLANLPSCPKCKSGVLRIRTGKNGNFFACSNYPDCKTTFPDKKGKPDFSKKKSPRKFTKKIKRFKK